MSDIEVDSIWVYESDDSKVQVNNFYEGVVSFYGDDRKYGELSESDFLNYFTPFNGLEKEVKVEVKENRYFHVHYGYIDIYGGTGRGSTVADFRGMLNHKEFNDLVLKDSLSKPVELKSVFILTWVEMSKEDCEEFLRGGNNGK